MAKSIDNEILTILAELECEGDLAKMYPKKLDRHVYIRLNKVLESLGGKWNRGRKGHVFAEGDAGSVIADAVTCGAYIDVKNDFQNFTTPPALAADVVKRAGCTNGEPVYEPSCGDGNIVDALLAAGCSNVHVCDIRPECVANNQAKNGVTFGTVKDFLTLKPEPKYAAIAMNPPFSRGQDIAHVRHAFDFLRPGGTLVSVMSPGFTFRNDRQFRGFREWATKVDAEWKENADGTFKSSGTNVRTIIFTVTKE